MKYVLLLLALILISGCAQKQVVIEITAPEPATQAPVLTAEELCINACNEAESLGNGPCLLNPIAEYPDWVCDVAHSPRQAIDNQEENQCSAFREGKATHFVEVNTKCELIKKI